MNKGMSSPKSSARTRIDKRDPPRLIPQCEPRPKPEMGDSKEFDQIVLEWGEEFSFDVSKRLWNGEIAILNDEEGVPYSFIRVDRDGIIWEKLITVYEPIYPADLRL